ncbi:hypothetical protein QUF50_04980 [Thiotrichales bacterium HSG1]|nr:hypothetical protein [Thiotrichales bacterium HSG1]
MKKNNNSFNHCQLSKWFLLIVLLMVASFPISSIALSCDNGVRLPKYAQLLEKIGKQTGISCEEAEAFIDHVDGEAIKIQKNFEQIASDKTPSYQKESLVKQTVDNYFDSPTSIVQTSGLNSSTVRNRGVERYLTDLADLSKEKYVTVKLLFDEKYFSMGNIELEYENGERIYSFKVSMWAHFIGCTDSGYCYGDHTKKGFYMKMQKGRMRVDFVQVEQTVSEKKYREIQCKWTGGC